MPSLPRELQRTQLSLFTLIVVLASLVLFPTQRGNATDQTSEISQKAGDVAKQTTAAVEKAGSEAADTAKTLWQRIDAARLKNRTPDQLVAWVIIGVLVAAVAGMMTPFKPTGSGVLGRLAFGLVGAFLGGILASVLNVNFGWGPVLIKYEELFFSLMGGVVLLLLAKLIGSRMKKKPAP